MAGLYDRLGSSDNVGVHHLFSVVRIFLNGDITAQQAKDSINARLATPLDAAAEADIQAMLDNVAGAGNLANKLKESLIQDAYCLLVEEGEASVTETVFRNKLNL